VLTVRSDEADKVEALDAGADDYVTKPFGMNELLARMRAALRRTGSGTDEEATVQAGELVVDLVDKRVRRGDDEVHLTPIEWGLVEQLVRNRDRLVTQRQLLHDVWGPQYDTETNYLRVHMANVRRKLEADPSRPRHFLTEPGMGYRFVLGD
jgi:two-component system KDP operon response regulator KdpE